MTNLYETRTGTEGDKNTPKPSHGHNPAFSKQTWENFCLPLLQFLIDIYAKYQMNHVETEEVVNLKMKKIFSHITNHKICKFNLS